MPRRILAPCGILLAAVILRPARAQDPPAKADDARSRPVGPGGVGGRGAITPVILVKVGAVREELRLKPEQFGKLNEVNGDFDKRRLESAKALARGDGRGDRGALMAMIAAMRAENEEAISRVLEPGQRKRLRQIALQLEGPMAVARPEIAARIAMNPDQIEGVQEIVDRYNEAQDRLWESHVEALRVAPADGPDGPRDPPPAGRKADPKAGKGGRAAERAAGERGLKARDEVFRRESDALYDEAVRLIGRVLTRRQKDNFNKLLGEPFDLAALRPGARRRPEDLPPDDQPTALEPIPSPPSGDARGRGGRGR